jgi:Skp family chaperone for outer membrane proteins
VNDNTRKLVTYGGIAAAVIIVALIGFFIYKSVTSDDEGSTDGTEAADTTTPPAAGGAAPPATSSGEVPYARILVVDRNEVLGRSNVGQGIMKQVQGLMDNARNGLKGREDALRKEYQDFQQQASILAAGVKDAKMKALQAKEAALRQDIQKQQLMIQGGLDKAREAAITALKPILHKIMVERGATMMVERSTLADVSASIDVTSVAIERLNVVLPEIKVVPQMPAQPPQQ